MNKAAKAEAKIARICQQLGISDAGHYWLDHAVDPFKDMIKPHPGYPDKTAEPSVVEVVKQTINVTSAGGVNWDASIFLDQLLMSQLVVSTSSANGQMYRGGQGGTGYTRGGLVVRTGASGTQLDITTTQNAMCLQVDPLLYASEDSRVIGVGFEVHDVTQELKKQGTVVVWRSDQPVEEAVALTVVQDAGVTACIPSVANCINLPAPPFLIQQALDIVGSQQWEAREGCYVTPVQASDTNPPLGLRQKAARAVENGVVYFQAIGTQGAQNQLNANLVNCENPWSMCGAFFGGLDPTAVLAVNFNYIVERFPNRSSAIRRLCYPSPQYDPRALELYSQMARSMPVGVTVEQNGIGDWIAGIANIAAGALSLIPHPIPKMIGGAIMTVGKNKLIQQGSQQLIKAAEEKIEEKKIENALVVCGKPREEAKAIAHSAVTTNSNSVARAGNYVAIKKGKRKNRLQQVGNNAMGPDSPWQKQKKMAGSSKNGTNM